MASEADPTNTTTSTATAPAAPVVPAVDPADLVRERFAAVAARAGLEEGYESVLHDQALAWCKAESAEPTRENLAKFVADAKVQKPKLFAAAPAPAAPANTAPAPAGARSTPTPTVAGVETPYGRWRSLKEAGRHDEAKAYYLTHERSINRSM